MRPWLVQTAALLSIIWFLRLHAMMAMHGSVGRNVSAAHIIQGDFQACQARAGLVEAATRNHVQSALLVTVLFAHLPLSAVPDCPAQSRNALASSYIAWLVPYTFSMSLQRPTLLLFSFAVFRSRYNVGRF